jgi:hypothetical protein
MTGKTVGGVPVYSDKNPLTREETLGLYMQASSWFSSAAGKKFKEQCQQSRSGSLLSK